MIRKPTWILLIIFCFAIGIAIFMENNPGLTSGIKTPTATVFPNLLVDIIPEKVVSIEFSPTNGEKINLSRNTDNAWSITSHNKLADSGKVEQLLTNLAELKIFSVIDSSLSKESVGLSKNPALIKITFREGNNYTIKIGNITTTDSGYYIQVDQGNLVVISKYGVNSVLDLLSIESLVYQKSLEDSSNLLLTPTQ